MLNFVFSVQLTVGILKSSSWHMSTKDILYDVSVSNHGARVRIILKEKGLENYVEIKSPQDIGHQIS